MDLYEFINYHLNENFTCNSELPFSVYPKKYGKGEVITDYGEVEKYGYYILSGITQAETITENKDVNILDFVFEGSFITAYMSFISQYPSNVRISAVTDCEVLSFHRSEIYKTYETSHLVSELGRRMAENKFIEKTQREINLLTKTAQERYEELFHSHPNIIRQIPINRIALYLGIHPESLSRIRKRVHG